MQSPENIECFHIKLPAFLAKTFKVSGKKAGSFFLFVYKENARDL